MQTNTLVYYAQMKAVVEYYSRSAHYHGERLLPIEDFEQGGPVIGGAVVLGRTGNFHHYDLRHIELLRQRGKIPAAIDTTLVLYDWHEELDHDPGGTELTAASWAYLGLVTGLYANIYILGSDPRGFNELNPYQCEEELHQWTEETIRLLDRLYLFPAEASYYCLKFFPECEHFLVHNHSVEKYWPVGDAGFVQVRFKGMDRATYENRKSGVVVSIDLDVLRRSELRTDCPQGVLRVDQLLAELDKLRATGPINSCLICGLTESAELRDEVSLSSVSRVLSKCSEIVRIGKSQRDPSLRSE